jgi:hypothetical protein
MKLINSDSPVFMNVSNNLVFQILGEESCASRSSFVLLIFPIKQMMVLTYGSLVHGNFPIYYGKLAMDFNKVRAFAFKN